MNKQTSLWLAANKRTFLWLAAGACLFLVCAALAKKGHDADTSGGMGTVQAKQACERTIEARLNYPATADFESYTFPHKTKSKNFIWRSHVTAKNAFGVPTKIGFLCEVNPFSNNVTVIM